MANVNGTTTRMVTKKELIELIEKNFDDGKYPWDYVAVITTVKFDEKLVQSIAFEKVLMY